MTLWMVRTGTGLMAQGKVNLDVNPCPAIMAGGIGGGNCSQYYLEDDGLNAMLTVADKPPYRVPLMAEIAALPWNGFKVVSTFSGCGGSCTGYRMAGFKVIWANEFVPAAQASYKANAAPDCHLDGRDIRQVKPEEILERCGLKTGELDLFDGSPPCQAFSTAVKREKGWGKAKRYEHGATQCNETLFTEYTRLLRGLMPKVFIAENVSGLVKGKAKGYFLEILAGLKSSGYRVEARLLDAQWLGVPQTRQRIIFQGVRSDLGIKPAWPKPLPYRYSVRDALAGIVRLTHDTSGTFSQGDVTDRPCPAITNGVKGLNSCHFKVQDRDPDTGASLHLPPSGTAADAFGTQDVLLDSPCPTVTIASPGNDLRVKHDESGQWSQGDVTDRPGLAGQPGRYRKLTIAELKRICSFPDDFILVGSYAQQWERLGNSVPPVMMRHIAEAVRSNVLGRLVDMGLEPKLSDA